MNRDRHHHHNNRKFQHDRLIKTFRAHLNQIGIENETRESAEELSLEVEDTYCPYCEKKVVSVKDSNPTAKTHIVAAILYLLLCVPFVYTPYIFGWFGKPIKRCSKCNGFLEEILIEDVKSEESITDIQKRIDAQNLKMKKNEEEAVAVMQGHGTHL